MTVSRVESLSASAALDLQNEFVPLQTHSYELNCISTQPLMCESLNYPLALEEREEMRARDI